MGGMALSVKPAQRINGYVNHKKISNTIVSLLTSRNGPFYIPNQGPDYIKNLIRSTVVFTKPGRSYSDVDFVIREDFGINKNFLDEKMVNAQIALTINSREWVTNGDVTSFEYQGHQLDFIRIPKDSAGLDWAAAYYGSGGVISAIANSILKPYDFKITLRGLEYQPTHNGRKLDWIVVPPIGHMSDTLGGILGYNGGGCTLSYTIHSGYNTEEELFADVKKMPFITWEALGISEDGSLSNLDRRHPENWGLKEHFVNYCFNDRNYINNLPPKPSDRQKQVLLNALDQSGVMLNLKAIAEKVIRRVNIEDRVKAKFNGNIIRNVAGIEGPQLGRFLTYLKSLFATETLFHRFMLSSILESIEVFVETHKARFLEADAIWLEAAQKVAAAKLAEDLKRIALEKERKEAEAAQKKKEEEEEALRMKEVAEQTKARLLARQEKEKLDLEAKMKLAVAMPPLPEPTVRNKKVVNLPPIPESIDHPRLAEWIEESPQPDDDDQWF